jgi:uncharacterized membrane protein YkvA (DUF1232 family)
LPAHPRSLLVDLTIREFQSNPSMKAPKKKPASATRRVSPKLPRKKLADKLDRPLQTRLESEFFEAVNSAKAYVKDPERLRDLATEVAQKALSLPQETFKGTFVYLQTMLRLIRAYYRGQYRAIPVTTLLIIVAALIYLVNPLDLIPDWIPGLGLIDDAFILALVVRRTREALDAFIDWESAAT